MEDDTITLTYLGKHKKIDWYMDERHRELYINNNGCFKTITHSLNHDELLWEVLTEAEGGNLEKRLKQVARTAIIRIGEGKSL